MKHVVLHHAHHPDEGVYRLVFARAEERVIHVEVENPDYDPGALPDAEPIVAEPNLPRGEDDAPSDAPLELASPEAFGPKHNLPTMVIEQTETFYCDLEDVVWADDDEQWAGLERDEIAARQRRLVRDARDRRVARHEGERAAVAQRRVVDLGGAGVEL